MPKPQLAADVGGTNTSFGLFEPRGDRYALTETLRFPTQELRAFSDALKDALDHFALRDARPVLTVSGAGPIRNRRCELTNAPWGIDATQIEKEFRVRTLLINDFSAICYGLPLLDPHDPEQLRPLAHPDGNLPEGDGNVRAAVGAGTGLGVGFLMGTQDGRGHMALPSEGGHVDFAPFDDESREYWVFLHDRFKTNPDSELLISGQGIANLFSFYREHRGADSYILRRIADTSEAERPAMISAEAGTDETCTRIMRRFVTLYGRFASNIAVTMLPMRGIYLAGGIASKNARWFDEDARFMRAFETHYKDSVRPILREIPVYIVMDYGVSLYGGAYAARLEGLLGD
jgi:glucokinase